MLGERAEEERADYHGVFANSGVENVHLPSTLKRLGKNTFHTCDNLKSIQLPQRLEYVGENCFSYSGVRELTLPSLLEEARYNAFDNSCYLTKIYVEDGCKATFSCANIPGSVVIIPLSTKIGGVDIQDLRVLRDVVIPEGVERIGNSWFWGSSV